MMRVCILACFISLLSVVICCNPEWFSYNQKCYRGIKFPYDLRLARRYCQTFRGDLATIKDADTLQNIGLSLSISSNESYWLNENSTISETVTTSACSYIYNYEKLDLGVNGDCTEGKYFICEVQDEEKDFVCPKSWSLYGNTCYKFYKKAKSYSQAVSFCSFQRAQLAVLDDIAKEHNAAAVIIGQKEAFLVAVNNTEMGFKWTSGKDFNPSCSECRNNTPGNCIGFSSDPQHPTMFTWVNLDCSSDNDYLCEMDPQIRSTTETTTEPATTLPPLHCPVGYNWKAHEASGFCYWETTYESERLNWYQARQFCQAYGGDLATYQDSNQEEHGLGGAKGHYRGLWFGLKRNEHNNVFHWVDNVTRNYTNWFYGEPNIKSRSKFCAMHGSSNSEWELDYCGVRRWFICKAPKSRDPKLPNIDLFKKKSCNFSGPSIYRTQWYLHDDYCYLVRDEAKYSWDTAQYFCQDNGGHMVSLHSFQETDFMLQTMPSSPNTNYWIGLSARGLDSSLSWSDGTPLNFLYWQDDFNGTESIDKCVTFDKQKGFWQIEHCNLFLGVICKRGVNASYDFTTPEPTPSLPGSCERGWYRFGNKCFKSFGKRWSQRMKWEDAMNSCQQLDATLLSIHNEEEQDFITDLVLDLGTSTWIGLHRIDKSTIFKWKDDSPLDYTNWNANEPSLSGDSDEVKLFDIRTQSKLCVELNYDTYNMGKWSDAGCYIQKAYICQKDPNPNITEPTDDPFECKNITGWNRLGFSCYKIFEDIGQELDWVAAQATCKTFGANLVVFKSSALAVFLKKRIQRKDQFFWIGTRETKMNLYQSVSSLHQPGLKSTRTTYTNWLSRQPQRTSETDNCVSIESEGHWIVKNCKEKHPFICELSSEEDDVFVQAEVEVSYTLCPPTAGWVDLGGDQCYYFEYSRVNWNSALVTCIKHGGNLASFHSSQEMNLVKNYLLKSPSESSFHIGLGKRSDGSYGWVDHTPLDFTNWEFGNPRSSVMSCVQLHPSTAKWRSVDCLDMMRNFICSASKGSSSNGNSRFSNTTGTKALKGEDIGQGLGPGAVFGIILCIMIVLIVIGGLIYRFYPLITSKVRPTLLEPDGL